MAIQLAARDRSQTGKALSSWLCDVFAGSICGVLSIAFGLSYAVLIFSGPLTPWLNYGVAATFVSTAIAAFVVALRGSLPFAIAGPDSSTSAVTAVLAAALVERLIARGDGAQVLKPTLIVMAIGSALTGILLCGLGLARWPRDTLRALSGYWWISRCDRLVGCLGCRASRDRSAAQYT